VVDEQENVESLQSKQHSKAKRKQRKSAPDTYTMDLSGGEGLDNPCTRESSLVRGYNALGVKHYSLDNEEKRLPFGGNMALTRSASSSAAPLTKFKLKVSEFAAPPLERPPTKAGARLRTASMSAMAMDLGFAGGESRTESKAVLPDVHMSSAPKAKLHGSLLPMIPSARKSIESIAVTMHMSKTASRWSNIGLRGSASAVF
jgi:hypothetical protein